MALVVICVLLVGVLVWAWAPAKAAPPGQTVPIPTATPPIEVPEATPTPDDGGDDGDDGSDDEVVDSGEEEILPEGDELEPAPAGQQLPEGNVVVLTQVGDDETSVYAGPGTSFALLGTLPAGTPVELIGRNAGLAWYVACCLPNGQAGWVAAAQLVDAPLAEVIGLPVLSDWRVEVVEDEAVVAEVTAADDVALDVLVSHSPQIVLPGEDVTLQFEITNLSTEDATDVRLRGEIVEALTFLTGQAMDGELVESAADGGPAVVLAEWPLLRPGELQMVTLTMLVGEDLPLGSVITQLVAVDAANAQATTAQALVGLPPDAVPSFR